MNQIAIAKQANLPALVERAAKALAKAQSYAEVLMAREMAKTVYDAAKRASRIKELQGAFDGLTSATKQAQRDALLVETEATAILALRYDEAQKRGEVVGRKGGAPKKTVPGGNGSPATTDQLGITRKLIHEGRQINKAKAAVPGIVQQTLDDLYSNGGEPTRSQLRGVIIKATRSPVERGNVPQCFTVKEWNALDADDRAAKLIEKDASVKFLKQTGSGIEWAQWSWNPVTGCLHECPYCYARDIAERYNAAFPQGFAPAFWPQRLAAPQQTAVPGIATFDARYRNVFTCSMADLFGRWVPKQWIIAVLDQVRANPQWNFLFLTKFPKRMAEFDIPTNAWMGTTVDLQARVANAEAAFAKLKDHGGVRWLSIEPLLEPLKFKRLDLFHWIVIGGASASTQTPEWRPPIDWIIDLRAQARAAGLAIYDKTNLYGSRTLELPFKAPVKGDPAEAPSVFHYLGKGALET